MLWGEPTTAERSQILTEAEEAARALGSHEWQRDVGHFSARHAFELGSTEARSKIADLLDDALINGRANEAFIAYWHGFTALLDGDFDEAERYNEAGLAGTVHPDFQSIGLAQLFLLRREQGRIGELEPIAEGVIESVPGLRAFGVALALARAELGRVDEAQAALDEWADDGFADFLFGVDKGVGLLVLGELIGACDAAERGRRAVRPPAALRRDVSHRRRERLLHRSGGSRAGSGGDSARTMGCI